jgi:DNA-binding NarL/FixJ family response regulator
VTVQAAATRVVIADDHVLLRGGLRQAIEGDRRFVVVGEADNGEDALAQIDAQSPDIAVLDIRMPKLDGFAVARELRTRRPDVAVVFLTLHEDEALLDAALDLGARGYLLKASAVGEVIEGLLAVAEGKHYVAQALTGRLIERRMEAAARPSPLAALTPAERRVLARIADYRSNKQIAAELFVHHRTIETHRANISQKLELRGHNALLRFALAHKDELARDSTTSP